MSLAYQTHSDTSREAAENNTKASAQRDKILGILHCAGIVGSTGDELSVMLNVTPGTISARLRDLELAGQIVKTANKRKTRSNRTANVYMTKQHHFLSGAEKDVKKKPSIRDYLLFNANPLARELLTEYERKYGQ